MDMLKNKINFSTYQREVNAKTMSLLNFNSQEQERHLEFDFWWMLVHALQGSKTKLTT